MNRQTIGDRIRARRKECRLTQKALAAKVGVSHVAISQWEKDETVPRGENLLRVAAALGCTPAWVFDGEGDLFMLPTSPTERAHAVPIISYQQAANWRGTAFLESPEGVSWLQSNVDLSSAAFALIITGNAMEPEFRAGDAIIIDPAVMPIPGDFVVAATGSEALFAKYRPRGMVEGEEVFELVPLNDDYPSLRSNQTPVSLAGTLIEHRRYRQKTTTQA